MGKKEIIQNTDKATHKRIIEKSKLTKEEEFALDAYIVSTLPITERKILAYSLSRRKEPTDNINSLEQQMYRWFKKWGVIYYIEDKEIELFGSNKGEKKEEDVNVIRTKEELIILVNQQITNAERNNDARAVDSLVKNLTQLQQLNKQEDDKESRITYFAPLKCSQCPIKKSATLAKDKK